MDKIRILPNNIIQTIAAGEVIERPYSIVKELLENAIDARAKNIDIHVDTLGDSKIKILDDGIGIDKRDLNLCIKRHATSKIIHNDLGKIDTLGFRGEALYAISAVSRIEIISKTEQMNTAFKIIVQDNNIIENMPSKGKNGTSVLVEKLFHNFPVRKKFLSNKKAENYYIRETIKNIAMSNPKINFNYYEDGKSKLSFLNFKNERNVKNRILEILGKDFYESSLLVEAKKSFFTLKGYISIPTYNKSSWKDSVIIVNNRVIKDRKILGVIKAAYSGLLAGNRFPVVVLSLCVPFSDIDVNVHPRKTEVSFYRIKELNSIIIKAIRKKLETSGLINSGIYEKKFLNIFSGENKEKYLQKKRSFFESYESFNSNELNKPEKISAELKKELDKTKTYRLGSAIAQINKMFIVSQTENKVILVDQHAAHERIVLEKLKSSYLNNNIERQTLLIPEIIKVDSNIKLFLNNKEKIEKLGIKFESYGEDSLLVRDIPSILGKIKIQELFDDLFIQLNRFEEVDLNGLQIEKLFSSIACHNSVRAGRKLNTEEMNNLLRLMESTPNSGQCNHGRPTFIELSIKDIERLFGRT